jgi:dihydroneopterin aldolase
MFTINLHKLIFFSFHGIHEEERILGNDYEVNVSISINEASQIDGLEQTVNYASLYQLIKQRMSVPTPLLETLAQDLAMQIHESDKRIRSISVSIEKKYPPLTNIRGSVSVTYTKNF